MIFMLVSKDSRVPQLLRVKVPRRLEAQPYQGFISRELAEQCMKLRGISADWAGIAPSSEVEAFMEAGIDVLVYRSIEQVQDAMKDPEGYDYESLIERHGV